MDAMQLSLDSSVPQRSHRAPASDALIGARADLRNSFFELTAAGRIARLTITV